MRLHRHDIRDFRLAFGLAFDLKRISQAGFALCWTAAVFFGTLGVLGWRLQDGDYTAGGVYDAWVMLFESDLTVTRVLLWGLLIGVWWIGFAYLSAPVHRSAAMDIARDERDRAASIPPLNRQATFAPILGMVLPVAMLLVVLLWSFVTYIPGMAGAIITAVTMPVALIAALIGAAFILVLIFAAPMMAPTAMVEGRDYFEALSRPMSYVLQQPGRYALYWLAKLWVMASSALAGAAVLALAWGFVALAMWAVGQDELIYASAREVIIESDLTSATSPVPFAIAVMFWTSAFMYAAWVSVVGLSCDTIMYLLMRYKIDGVTFDKITVADEKARMFPNAIKTAEQAEEARKRFDEQQGDGKSDAEKPTEPKVETGAGEA